MTVIPKSDRWNKLGSEPRRSPLFPPDPTLHVGDSWLKPGEEKKVWVFVSGQEELEEAISAVKRMVAANELEWVRLYALVFETVGKGPNAVRWAANVLVRLPDTPPPEIHVLPLPEGMP